MKQILLMIAVVAVVVGCSGKKTEPSPKAAAAAAEAKPLTEEESAKVIEVTIRKAVNKPTGKLTKADLEKVTKLIFSGKSLRDEKLGGNKLTSVKGLEKLTQLKELWLVGSLLRELPKELEKLTQLTYLRLSGNKLTSVKQLEKLDQLTYLRLYKNQLTDVKGLEKLTQLEYLSLDDNPDLTKAQINELKKALPNCYISSDHKK